MRRLADLARKLGDHVSRRLGSSSCSGEPLTGSARRAAPGQRKVPSEMRPKKGKVAPVPASHDPPPGAGGKSGELSVPAETRAKRAKPLEALTGAVGRAAPGDIKVPAEPMDRSVRKVTRMPASQDSGSSAASMRLPPPAWKAAEANRRIKIGLPCECEASTTKMSRNAAVRKGIRSRCFNDGLASSTESAPSTSRSPPPPPPPHAESDFWFKFMMAGGAAVAFILDFLKGQVEREVDLKMTRKDADDKAKLIMEQGREIQSMQEELKKADAAKERRGRWWFWL